MNERIRKLRRTLDLTQLEFAERLGIKRNTIANYETGRNEPISAVISLICREFNVNEEWLRTGEGEMFFQPRNKNICHFNEKDFPFQEAIDLFSSLDKQDWEIIFKLATTLAEQKRR